MQKDTTEKRGGKGLRCARCQRKLSGHTIEEFFTCINDVCALTAIAVLVLGVFLLPQGFAFQMQNIELDENLQPLDLPATNPALVTVSSGMIHGVLTSRDSFAVQSDMPDFVSSEGINQENGYTASFAGYIQNGTQETIRFLNPDGSVAYSIILIAQQEKPKQNTDQQSWQVPSIQNLDWAWWVAGLGIISVLIFLVVMTRRKAGQRITRFR